MADRAEKILVADGEEHILELLERYLGNEGYQVSTACDSVSALEKFHAEEPDLVVLDSALDESGLEVLRRIRSGSSVPVIMFAAYGAQEEKDAGLELGADEMVSKPFRPRDLVLRVQTLLRRSRLNRATNGG
jgi:DNA-binding response OmpR family regulator